MDANLKAKWVKALRSGRYDQHDGDLANKQGTAFCCLGVLADIQGCLWRDDLHALIPVDPKTGWRVGEGTLTMKKFCGGLTDDDQSILAGMNDEGKSFAEIADFIETNH